MAELKVFVLLYLLCFRKKPLKLGLMDAPSVQGVSRDTGIDVENVRWMDFKSVSLPEDKHVILAPSCKRSGFQTKN